MNYLLIKNGLVISGNRVFKADVLIGNQKILDIQSVLSRPEPETPVIDASGRFVFPGAIDMSNHHWETQLEEEAIERLMNAEIVSGTTTIFKTMEPNEQTLLSASFELLIQSKDRRTDYALHLSPDLIDHLAEKDIVLCYLKYGIVSYVVSSIHYESFAEANFDNLIKVLQTYKLTLIIDLTIPEPEEGFNRMTQVRYSHDVSKHIKLLVNILERLKNVQCPVLFSKLRFKEEVLIFDKYLSKNPNLHAEIELPCFLGELSPFEVDELTMLGGIKLSGKLNPILPDEFREYMAIENYLAARPTLSLMIGNTANSSVFNRPDEYFGLKNFASMLYTLNVINGNLAITDFVACISTRPAKLMGLFPQKGIMRAGADADIVIWNPDFERNIYCNLPSGSDDHELKLQGKAEFVFLGGKMVYDGETFYQENLKGNYVYRSPVA